MWLALVACPLWNTIAHLVTVLYRSALYTTASTSLLWHSLAFLPHKTILILVHYSSWVTSILHNAWLTTEFLSLCYSSIANCPVLQCLCTTSAILAGAHSYFVVSFKCEGNNSCHYLICQQYIHSYRKDTSKEGLGIVFVFVLMGWSLLPNALRPFWDLLCSPEFRYY